MSDLAKKEEDRIFCIHDIEHCLDVARISYILAFENGIKIDKEIVYGAALLHDIGRAISVENHEIESVKTAREILKKCETLRQYSRFVEIMLLKVTEKKVRN